MREKDCVMTDGSALHILIVEVNLDGHHAIYLQKIAESYMRLGHVVTVVVSENCRNHNCLNYLFEIFNHQLQIYGLKKLDLERAFKSKFGDVGREIWLWNLFRKTHTSIDKNRKVDFVLLPYGDYCLNAFGLLGSPFGKSAWGAICMRPAFHLKECGVIAPTTVLLNIKRHLFKRALQIKTLNTLFSIDELLPTYINKKYPKIANKLVYLPDPAEPPMNLDSTELRQRYRIPLNAKLILVYGAINERKGILNLLDALELSPALCEWHALVVGRQSQEVRDALSTVRWSKLNQSNRIHAIDEFVTDEIEHHVFAICDVVWVAYVKHYTMSGVIVRAGMNHKPVISCKEGLIGWFVRVHGVGLIVDSNIEGIQKVIVALEVKRLSEELGKAGYLKFFLNTWPVFFARLLANSK